MRGLRATRWCAMISGRGSNLSALIDNPTLDLRLVVTTDSAAAGVPKARRGGIDVMEAPLQAQAEYERAPRKIDWVKLDRNLTSRSIDAIFLLGFMRIVPASFLSRWNGRILNLHPSLLPAFPGLRSIERAVQAGAACGATVHEVVAEVDAGHVLANRTSWRAKAGPHSAGQIEMLVHIDEQRLVKEIVEKWRPREI